MSKLVNNIGYFDGKKLNCLKSPVFKNMHKIVDQYIKNGAINIIGPSTSKMTGSLHKMNSKNIKNYSITDIKTHQLLKCNVQLEEQKTGLCKNI